MASSRPMQTTWAAECTRVCRVAPDLAAHGIHLLEEPAGLLDRPEPRVEVGGVAGGEHRRAPPAPTPHDDRHPAGLHGLRRAPGCRAPGSAAPSCSKVDPAGVDHRPVMTASCSSSRSKRSPTGGKGMPKAACSCSNQPAPSPSSTRPPLIWSTPATVTASGPGSRNVAELTRVPSRIRRGVAGEPGQGGPGVGGPGGAVARHVQVVVGAEEAVEPQLLGGAGHREEVVVGRALLGLGEDPEVHPPTLGGGARACRGSAATNAQAAPPAMSSRERRAVGLRAPQGDDGPDDGRSTGRHRSRSRGPARRSPGPAR